MSGCLPNASRGLGLLPVFSHRSLGLGALALLSFVSGCTSGSDAPPPLVPFDCAFGDGEGAPSTCLTPKHDDAHYEAEAHAYFDTLDVSADPTNIPAYSERSARWEWPPWLKLTGYGRNMLVETAAVVTKQDPSTIPTRDCRAFEVQPFARCRVVFEYEGGPCPIYEEFTFNDQGEMTFIEAWTDAPGLGPTDLVADPWAEGPNVHRLSTRVPGLGNATGLIDPAGPWMAEIGARDAEVADFAARAQNFWGTWFQELAANGKDIYPRGCGWKR